MELRVCTTCEQEKPVEEFYSSYKTKCKECLSLYAKEHNKDPEVQARNKERHHKWNIAPENRDRIRAKTKRWREKPENRKKDLVYATARQNERQEFLNSVKQVPCADCGNLFPPCAMDFDHVDGEKFSGVAEMKSYSMERIKEEIAKCDIVCSNCHRIRTFQRRGSDEALTTLKPILIGPDSVTLHPALYLTPAFELGTVGSNIH